MGKPAKVYRKLCQSCWSVFKVLICSYLSLTNHLNVTFQNGKDPTVVLLSVVRSLSCSDPERQLTALQVDELSRHLAQHSLFPDLLPANHATQCCQNAGAGHPSAQAELLPFATGHVQDRCPFVAVVYRTADTWFNSSAAAGLIGVLVSLVWGPPAVPCRQVRRYYSNPALCA